MRILKISPIFLIFLAACQNNTETLDYKNSEAVYINLEKTYVLHSDGKTEYSVEKEQKLLTHRSFHSLYGQTDIYYNPEKDSVVVEIAETKTPSGEIIPVPENGFVDMIPSYALGSSQYSHLKHKAVVHTALEIGSVVHSKYTVYSENANNLPMMGHEILTQDCPVENYRLTIKVPKGEELDFNAINIEDEPKIRNKGSFKVYTWTLKNIPEVPAEKFLAGYNAWKKQIIFSSADSLFPVFNQFTSQAAFTFETSIEIREEINKRLTDQYTTFGKLGTLQKIVIEEIQSTPVSLQKSDFSVKTAIDTWESMSGTQEDKAILLTAMVRNLGFDAVPVAVIPKYYFKKDTAINEIGNLELLAFHLVQVPVDGVNFYLDVNSTHVVDPIAKLPNHWIIPLEMGYRQVHLVSSPDFEYQLSWDGNVYFDPRGLMTGSFDANYIGRLNPYLGINLYPESINSLYKGQSVIEVSSPRSTLITFMTDLSDQVTTVNEKSIMDLPLNTTGFDSWGMNSLSENRNSTLYLPYPVREFQRLSITIPSGYQAMNFLTDVTVTNDLGRVSIRYSNKNGNLEVMRNLNISKAEISADEYALLKELVKPWVDPSMRRLAIERIN